MAKSITLYALSRVDHDGKTYGAGDKLPAMEDAQANLLLASGAASKVKPSADEGDAPAEGAGSGEGSGGA